MTSPASPAAAEQRIHETSSQDVVLFDGNCRFCQQQVRRLKRLDTANRLSFLSLHDPQVAERYPDLSHAQLMQQMYIVSVAGERYGGAAAFRYLTRRLPWLWPLAPLMHIPYSLPFWQALYRQVARRRYRLRGGRCDSGSCRV